MILTAYGIPTETVNLIMILYQNTRFMVISPDGYTQLFDITTGVLKDIRLLISYSYYDWILYYGKKLIMMNTLD